MSNIIKIDSESRTRDIKTIVDEICKNYHIELLLLLPSRYRKTIRDALSSQSSSSSSSWRVRAYRYFLENVEPYQLSTIDYDHPICDLQSIKISLSKYKRGDLIDVPSELQLKGDLAYIKSGIDRFVMSNGSVDKKKKEFYGQVTNLLDQFASYRKRLKAMLKMPYLTNAYLKCWEMIHDYKLIPRDHPSTYRVFCNAEFPGAFIFAINQYMSTSTDNPSFEWFGNSLWPGSDAKGEILSDEFGLYKRHANKWLMDGKTYDGDVTSLRTIDHIYEKIGESADLYTSDIGIPLDVSNFNDQEEVETPLNLGQIICGLVSLKRGGHLICKMFMFFTPFNISMLWMLTEMFEEFYLSKPVTSRPGNSEIYIIGKGYRGYQTCREKIDKLKEALSTSSYGEQLCKVPEEFYLRIVNASYEIYQRQMRYVDMSVKVADYLYRNKMPVRYNEARDDRRVMPNTSVSLRDEIKHREEIVNEWKETYKEHLLAKKLHLFL